MQIYIEQRMNIKWNTNNTHINEHKVIRKSSLSLEKREIRMKTKRQQLTRNRRNMEYA